MLRIVVLVSGGGTNLQALIDGVKNGTVRNTQIAAVISNNAGAYALTRAQNAGIEALCISPKDYPDREAFHEALLAKLAEIAPDLIVLAGYLVNIPPQMVEAYRGRIINVHPSLIPSFCGKGYYGLKVHEAALARGVKVTGATVHIVDEGTDTGRILMQKAVEVREGDTPEVLQRRVMEQAEWVILPAAVDAIARGELK
ncbi:MAG: phosphoribosylglycinamide formyltransferase [Lachnospiraceae bacterium]|nr:phosphoribosylglycinamide formyltransferase [Lachnospiraceae bacterium]